MDPYTAVEFVFAGGILALILALYGPTWRDGGRGQGGAA